MTSGRKLTITVLILLTIGLGAASVYIGLQSTSDSGGGVVDQGDQDTTVDPTDTDDVSVRNLEGGCTLEENDESISVDCTNGSGGVVKWFSGDSCPTDDNQIGGDISIGAGSGGGEYNVSDRNGDGNCTQVDFVPVTGASHGGGVCECGSGGGGGGGGGLAYCGASCEQDSDCLGGIAGDTTVAASCEDQNGDGQKECVSTTCFEKGGTTVPGRNCDCSGANLACGDRCGGAFPTCAGDELTCSFVLGPAGRTTCSAAEFTDNQRCLPIGGGANSSQYDVASQGYQMQACTDGFATEQLTYVGGTLITDKTAEQAALEACQVSTPVSYYCTKCTDTLGDGNTCDYYEESTAECLPGYTRVETLTAAQNCELQATGGACEEIVTTEVPEFDVVKQAAEVCNANGTTTVTYTITVTNTGGVSGIIDSVVDDYDSKITTTPTGITPTYGTASNGQVSWIGTEAERTFAAGQTKTYSYAFTFSATQVASYGSVRNTVTVQFDTDTQNDNVRSFTHSESLDCRQTTLPRTGLFDGSEPYALAGLALFASAILLYVSGGGQWIVRNLGIKLYYMTDEKARFENNINTKLRERNG